MAQRRGLINYDSATTKSGYVMENVPSQFPPSQYIIRVWMFSAFIERVSEFLKTRGDLASMLVKRWTHIFRNASYEVHDPMFKSTS